MGVFDQNGGALTPRGATTAPSRITPTNSLQQTPNGYAVQGTASGTSGRPGMVDPMISSGGIPSLTQTANGYAPQTTAGATGNMQGMTDPTVYSSAAPSLTQTANAAPGSTSQVSSYVPLNFNAPTSSQTATSSNGGSSQAASPVSQSAPSAQAGPAQSTWKDSSFYYDMPAPYSSTTAAGAAAAAGPESEQAKLYRLMGVAAPSSQMTNVAPPQKINPRTGQMEEYDTAQSKITQPRLIDQGMMPPPGQEMIGMAGNNPIYGQRPQQSVADQATSAAKMQGPYQPLNFSASGQTANATPAGPAPWQAEADARRQQALANSRNGTGQTIDQGPGAQFSRPQMPPQAMGGMDRQQLMQRMQGQLANGGRLPPPPAHMDPETLRRGMQALGMDPGHVDRAIGGNNGPMLAQALMRGRGK